MVLWSAISSAQPSIPPHRRKAMRRSELVLWATGLPPLPAHKVATAAAPLDAVLAAGLVGVRDVGAAVSPPRVVVAVVHARGAWGRPLVVHVGGGAGEGSGDGREGDYEG